MGGVWTWFEGVLAATALVLALGTRPWRMLTPALWSPLAATMTCLPLVWLLPQHLPPGLSVQFSGASLLVLLVGWPLAVCGLAVVAVLVGLLGHNSPEVLLSQWVWLGVLPATLALLWGAGLRRWLPLNPFVYTLGRGFLGTAVAVFVPGVLYEVGHHLLYNVPVNEALVARWLMAWADAFLTGLVVAVLVAFAPQHLATWSDQRYLRPPPPPPPRP